MSPESRIIREIYRLSSTHLLLLHEHPLAAYMYCKELAHIILVEVDIYDLILEEKRPVSLTKITRLAKV